MSEFDKIQPYEPAQGAAMEVRHAQPARPYELLEAEEVPHLLAYWHVLRKRRWTILTIFFVLFVLVLLATLRMTPVYRAMALLEIQKENPNILTVQELFELETVSDTYLETQYKILRSESLARRVVSDLGLARLEEFNPPERWWSRKSRRAGRDGSSGQVFAVPGAATEPHAEVLAQVLERFADRLTISPVKRSRLVEISFESADSALAARVLNSLAHHYIEQNLEARWEATQKASEWLSQQLLGLKARLEKSEEELQHYARAHGLLFLENEERGAENIMNERLRQLQQELTAAQAARIEKESLYRLVESGEFSALPGAVDNRLLQDLTVRLAEIRREHAQLSTTFTPEYPRVQQLQNQMDELERVLKTERERIARRVANDYRASVQRESLLQRAFETQKEQANLIAERSVQYNILRREVETNKQLYEGLLHRLREAGVSAGLRASNVRVVDPAEPPETPAKPRLLLNLSLAFIFGLGLGVAAAFLQEYLDNTLKTAEDIERFLGVPALALVPSVESLNGRRSRVYGVYGRMKSLAAPDQQKSTALLKKHGWFRIDRDGQASMLAEAFRSLRTSVLLSAAEHPPRTLLVSSAQPGEGKTTVSTNLAISLSQLGEKVLLIDGDLRRPCVHRTFEIKDPVGVVSYLTGRQDWRSAVHPTGIPNLEVLCCGPIPPNPAELLSSARMRALIQEATQDYKFVVVDSPPLLNVADARILATLVEGVLLVVKGGATPRQLVERAQANTQTVGGNLIGVVLNDLDVRSDDYYYHYYRYDYYGPREESSERG